MGKLNLILTKLLPWLLIILGAALRLIGLGWDSLWYDEAFSAWLVRLPLADMLQAIQGDVHPPLWYLIEWGTIRLAGSSEMALRLPACILGIASLPLAWAVARRLAPWPASVIALAIFALSPFQIYYSQEARMYALLQVCVLLAAWAMLARRYAILAAAGLAGLLTHNLMVIYLVPIFGLAVWRYRYWFQFAHKIGWGWLKSWGPGVAGATIALCYAPWAAWLLVPHVAGVTIALCYAPWATWLLVPQLVGVGASFWVQPLTAGGFFYPLYMLTFHIAAPAWLQLHAGMLVVALVIWGSVEAWRRGFRSVLFLAWGPLAILAAISLAWRPVYLHRTLIGAALPLYLLVAFGLVALARVARWQFVAPLGLVLMLATGNYYLDPNARRWDVRTVAAALQCQPGDVIYHVNLASYILYQYYRPDCNQWVWPVANDLSQSLTNETKLAMGMQQAGLDVLNWRRAWLVWAESPVMAAGEPGEVGAILMKHNYTLFQQIEPGPLVTLRVWEVTP